MDGYQNQASKAKKKFSRLDSLSNLQRILCVLMVKQFTLTWALQQTLIASSSHSLMNGLQGILLQRLSLLMSIVNKCQLGQINWFSGFGRRNKSFTVCRQKNEESGKRYIVSFFFDFFLFFYRFFLFAACSSITRSGKSIQKQDVCDLQREVLFEDDSSYAIILNELYVVGASIAIMALLLKVANSALQDLGRLAGLCTTTKSAKDFWSNPKAKTFASWWNQSRLARAHVSQMQMFFFCFFFKLLCLLFRIPIQNKRPCRD